MISVSDSDKKEQPLVFVIHKHDARVAHFDLRLEKDGVLKSWALPKGLPDKPGVRRLAVETEDHNMASRDFEGEIPKGHYGAGTMMIWDHGTYVCREWTDNHILVRLSGTRVNGSYHLVRYPKDGPKSWLLFAASEGRDSAMRQRA